MLSPLRDHPADLANVLRIDHPHAVRVIEIFPHPDPERRRHDDPAVVVVGVRVPRRKTPYLFASVRSDVISAQGYAAAIRDVFAAKGFAVEVDYLFEEPLYEAAADTNAELIGWAP
jgi:hypothetical protein